MDEATFEALKRQSRVRLVPAKDDKVRLIDYRKEIVDADRN